MACISRSKRKQKMSVESELEKQNKRPLTPWEIEQADRRLECDGYPMCHVTNEVRLQVLVKMGLRK
jgi:hypothetical protein